MNEYGNTETQTKAEGDVQPNTTVTQNQLTNHRRVIMSLGRAASV